MPKPWSSGSCVRCSSTAEGPDVSFFEIEVVSGNSKLARPIALAKKPRSTRNVAVVGYPAYDSRIPDTDLMERIYGRTYNKKRLAPGGVTRVEQFNLLHDCTTLGGNSGSVVVDLDSGAALGLHFSGKFMTTNYAVRSDIVKRLLDAVRAGHVKPEVKTVAADSRQPRSKPSLLRAIPRYEARASPFRSP